MGMYQKNGDSWGFVGLEKNTNHHECFIFMNWFIIHGFMDSGYGRPTSPPARCAKLAANVKLTLLCLPSNFGEDWM